MGCDWAVILLLRTIRNIVFSSRVTEYSTYALEGLVEGHHDLFLKVFLVWTIQYQEKDNLCSKLKFEFEFELLLQRLLMWVIWTLTIKIMHDFMCCNPCKHAKQFLNGVQKWQTHWYTIIQKFFISYIVCCPVICVILKVHRVALTYCQSSLYDPLRKLHT